MGFSSIILVFALVWLVGIICSTALGSYMITRQTRYNRHVVLALVGVILFIISMVISRIYGIGSFWDATIIAGILFGLIIGPLSARILLGNMVPWITTILASTTQLIIFALWLALAFQGASLIANLDTPNEQEEFWE